MSEKYEDVELGEPLLQPMPQFEDAGLGKPLLQPLNVIPSCENVLRRLATVLLLSMVNTMSFTLYSILIPAFLLYVVFIELPVPSTMGWQPAAVVCWILAVFMVACMIINIVHFGVCRDFDPPKNQVRY